MLDRAVVKEFLIEEFEDANPIPDNIDINILVEDFSIYVENDFYEWLKDNFNSYFYNSDFDWDSVKDKLQNNPTQTR
ncbi:MAG: hypothetical protein AAB071_02275 [Bacteroidota bacterium]